MLRDIRLQKDPNRGMVCWHTEAREARGVSVGRMSINGEKMCSHRKSAHHTHTNTFSGAHSGKTPQRLSPYYVSPKFAYNTQTNTKKRALTWRLVQKCGARLDCLPFLEKQLPSFELSERNHTLNTDLTHTVIEKIKFMSGLFCSLFLPLQITLYSLSQHYRTFLPRLTAF